MFEGFRLDTIDIGELEVRARVGGEGPPLLLLHGNPQTHLMWRKVAPRLAETHTVVAPDLRGYGRTTKPSFTSTRVASMSASLSGNSVRSSPITSSFTQFDSPASRPRRAVRMASSAV